MPYTKQTPVLCKGPCVVCGMTDYTLSMGGPHICPSCDCGIDPNDPRHARNAMKKLDAAQPLDVPVLMPASRDQLLLAGVEGILRELQMLNSRIEIISNQLAQIQMVVAPRQGFEETQEQFLARTYRTPNWPLNERDL